MKSLYRRFLREKSVNPNSGDYILLANAIAVQNFTKEKISRWFTKLVSNEDYYYEERQALIRYLFKLSCAPKKDPTSTENRQNLITEVAETPLGVSDIL